MLRLKRRDADVVDGATDWPLVRLDNIAVRFDATADVLADASLSVHGGEFVTLLGPSGCGKSTLLNVTAGTVRPRHGTVHFDGRPVTGVNRNVGYVTQEDTMLPWLSLAANVGLPLRMRRMSRAVVKARVTELLTSFGLEHAAARYPAQLSGGMKKRGLLARAMIYEPRLLLMDEPFAALDEITRFRLNNDLLALWRKLHKTVIFVTHSVFESVYLSQRVIVMTARPGRISAEFRISATEPRGEEFRTSAEYAGFCRQVSNALAPAYAGQAGA
jgi:NitT/TauT family transport system ATP-binding protein